MGLFDSFKKKDIFLEEKENKKITQLRNMETSFKEELDSFINKYSQAEENRLYCDKELFWDNAIDTVSKDIDITIGNYICSELYNTIVVDKDNDNQIRRFYRFKELFLDNNLLKAVNHNKIIDDFSTLYSLFNDKESALNILKILYAKDEGNKLVYDIVLRDEIKDFLIETRKNFNDEGAYISLVFNTIKSIELHSYNLETSKDVIKQATIMSRQLAGFYEIDEVGIAKLPGKVKKITDDIQNRYDHLVQTFADKEDAVEAEKFKAITEFKNVTSGILGEADETIAKVNSARDSAMRQLEGKEKDIQRKIDNFLGEHPEGEEALRSKETGYNELLDMRIPAKERYEKVKKLGIDSIQGLEDCIKNTLNNEAVLIQGPTGCGKSTAVRKTCELLNLRLYNIGYITEEFTTIRGFIDANGNYQKSNFYDCYKYGGACLLDEIDMSSPEALLELNKITGGEGYLPYLFPNGELVQPHPNFRLFATANTFGQGGNVEYHRNPMDSSSIDRYSIIKLTYDEKLEREILSDYPEVYQYLITYREAISAKHLQKMHVTTKTMSTINKDLQSGIIALEDALRYKLIKGESPDTYTSLNQYVIDKIGNTKVTDAFEKAIKKDKLLRK